MFQLEFYAIQEKYTKLYYKNNNDIKKIKAWLEKSSEIWHQKNNSLRTADRTPYSCAHTEIDTLFRGQIQCNVCNQTRMWQLCAGEQEAKKKVVTYEISGRPQHIAFEMVCVQPVLDGIQSNAILRCCSFRD